MLQQMRSLAKYVWLFVAFAFIGGFLLYETSGLIGGAPVTPSTPVGVVNRREILYADFTNRVQAEINNQQQPGQTLSEDDTRMIEDEIFDQVVMEILLDQEYRRRGIFVTDDEIRQYARFEPPPQLINSPELQTDGQFDPVKYERFLGSSTARQMNLLQQLESYYRVEIPRRKLFDQVASGVYVTDADLWRVWRDEQDSVQVTYAAFRPSVDTIASMQVSDADLRRYFDAHKEEFRRPGRAVLSVSIIPKVIGPADSAASFQRALDVRAEILGGARFEDVAARESIDPDNRAEGGQLPRGGRGRFVEEFERAAYDLRVGEISRPVLTMFGYHLIRVDERTGDTLALRHILLPVQMSDSAAMQVDRRADSLANLTALADDPAKFDAAMERLGMTPIRLVAFEGEPASFANRRVPSVSAWAFSGVRAGETSNLFDDDNGYYLARLDSLIEGGEPRFDAVRDEVRARLAVDRALDAAMPVAERFAAAARGGFEAAAEQAGLETASTPLFTRGAFVPGLGQVNEAIGAAFALPPGTVSAPVRTSDAVYVLRVDRRIDADSATWVAQKDFQRQMRLEALQSQRIQQFLEDLRGSAKVDDRRKQINAAQRRLSG